MSKRVAYIFKGCELFDNTSEPLKHLDNNVEKIKEALENIGGWKVTSFDLETSKTLHDALKSVIDNTEIEEFLFYYTGHGKGHDEGYYLIGEEDKNINLLDAFSLNEFYSQKVSIVVDACESHHLINKWDNRRPYEILVATKSGLAYEGNLSDMSDFSHEFCRLLIGLSKESGTGVYLEDIQKEMKFSTKQEAEHICVKERFRSIIVNQEVSSEKINLTSLQINLKKVISDDGTLRLYANNLLSKYLNKVNLPEMNYDEIVEHLYDLRQPILCLLHNLNSDILEQNFNALKLEFIEHNTNECCSLESMEKDELNLLINFEVEDEDLSRTKVTIWKYEEPYAIDVKDLEVDLTKDENPIALVDAIFSLVNVSEDNVLLEFILPFELIDIDISSWQNLYEENLVETFRVVHRLSERIERCRNDIRKMESWNKFWQYYKNNQDKTLDATQLPREKSIRFLHLKNTPYIFLDEQLSIGEYGKILNTSASIVYSPIGDDREDFLKKNINIKEELLKDLVEKNFELFCDIPHVLIWDNPSRQIPEKKENTGE